MRKNKWHLHSKPEVRCSRKGLSTRWLFLVLLIFSQTVFANVSAQPVKEFKVSNASLKACMLKIEQETGLGFLNKGYEINEINNISVDLNNTNVDEVLQEVLKNTDLTYEIVDGVILMKKAPEVKQEVVRQVVAKQESTRVTGKVVDDQGLPLPGVAVVIGGTHTGTSTNMDGEFEIEIPAEYKQASLVFSFIGMKTQVITYSGQKTINVKLLADQTTLNDVVVNGFYTKRKNSFTGSVKTITSDDIKAVSNTNLVSTISSLTPGLRLVESNEFGSDPNKLPEIIIRGSSSLSQDEDVSQPIILLDGVEISLRDLYDVDINEIDRVDVLKDASATSLYGERASNGVIIIQRSKIASRELRLTYSLDGKVDMPDLSSYNYLNSADKLEFERLAGLYDFADQDEFENYNRKKLLISKGLDTDWMSKPLRKGYTLNNSVGVSGRSGNLSYRINGNLKNSKGVMKGDYRKSNGLSFFFSYHLNDKLTVSFNSAYSESKSKDSPYGRFSDYTIMNPYDSPYDEFGELDKQLSWQMSNPLYEATVGNSNERESSSLKNNLNIRWDITKGIYLTSKGTVSKTNSHSEFFRAPESNYFLGEGDLNKKGSLRESNGRSLDYSGNVVLNFYKEIGVNNFLSIHMGSDVYKKSSEISSYTSIGYLKHNIRTPNFASGYPEGGNPSGTESISTSLGAFVNANFIYKNKYYVDGSYRKSGSSKFGSANRYAPFWSVGGGWNIHNEEFIKPEWVDLLKVRYSYGTTGNVSFSPYQAITTYLYSGSSFYWNRIGATPITMGNPNLSWQITKMHNWGMNANLFGSRLNLTLDYYRKNTDDLLIDLTTPPSVGVTSVKENLGEMRNTGIEFDVFARIIQTKDWQFNVKVNGSHNENTILKISNGLAAANKEANEESTVLPNLLLQEGGSSTAIYAVRSAGINPATGEEIFIDKNGDFTSVYNVDDKVVVGDRAPDLQGVIMPSVYYKNWALNVVMRYQFGGQVYNSTRARNVENVNPKYNVDSRAFDERWKNVNDVVPYLGINQDYQNRHTSRFVEDDNYLNISRLELSYQFGKDIVKKLGFKKLRVSVGLNEIARFSSVKYERGTSYPFSRGFSFSIKPTF